MQVRKRVVFVRDDSCYMVFLDQVLQRGRQPGQGGRFKCSEGLVQQQYAWPHHQCPGNRHTLLLVPR